MPLVWPEKKLNYEAFVELYKTQIDHFYETEAYETWNGFWELMDLQPGYLIALK